MPKAKDYTTILMQTWNHFQIAHWFKTSRNKVHLNRGITTELSVRIFSFKITCTFINRLHYSICIQGGIQDDNNSLQSQRSTRDSTLVRPCIQAASSVVSYLSQPPKNNAHAYSSTNCILTYAHSR